MIMNDNLVLFELQKFAQPELIISILIMDVTR